jgi:broad-specificity NMP kinase
MSSSRMQADPVGTPGTGKTLHSTLLAQNSQDTSSPFEHLNVGDLVKKHGFHEGWDEKWEAYTVDEDKLLDYMEEVVNPENGSAETGTSSRVFSFCFSFTVKEARLDSGATVLQFRSLRQG